MVDIQGKLFTKIFISFEVYKNAILIPTVRGRELRLGGAK